MSVPEENIENLSDDQLDTLFDEQANAPEEMPTETAPEEIVDKKGPEDIPVEIAPALKDVPESKQDEPDESQKTVPLAALHEERQKRKEQAQRIQQMESRFQRFLDEQARREAADAAPLPPQPPPLEENPIGHFAEKIAQLEAKQAADDAARQRAMDAQTQEAQWQRVLQTYDRDAMRLREADPAFADAYQYWGQSRTAELRAGGASEEQATKILQQEEAAAVIHALQQGESPAERVYAIAKARGYTPKPTAASSPDLDVIAKGQKTATGTPGGGRGPVADSLEALSMMDDADFEANFERIINKHR